MLKEVDVLGAEGTKSSKGRESQEIRWGLVGCFQDFGIYSN